MKVVILLVVAACLLADVGAAEQTDVPSQPVVQQQEGGVVLEIPHWFREWREAIETIGDMEGRTVVFCHYGRLSIALRERFKDTTAHLVYPDGLAAVRSLTEPAGYVVHAEYPRFWIVEDVQHGQCALPFRVLFQRTPSLGKGGRLPSPSGDVVEQRLYRMQDSFERSFRTESYEQCRIIWYWPSIEDTSVFYTLLQFVDSTRNPMHPPVKTLRKIRLAQGKSGKTGEVIWSVQINGPVADLEYDFDQDGIVDIVAFSGAPSSEGGKPPLRVLSGATGKEMGKIDGYHFRILRVIDGSYTVLSRGREGPFETRIKKGGEFVAVKQDPTLQTADTKVVRGLRWANENETVKDEFKLAFPPITLASELYPELNRISCPNPSFEELLRLSRSGPVRLLLEIGRETAAEGEMPGYHELLAWPGSKKEKAKGD